MKRMLATKANTCVEIYSSFIGLKYKITTYKLCVAEHVAAFLST